MPQIDVYIFRFFPFFIFFVFLFVYMYVYFIMLPNLAGVLKFRIKYRQNLSVDILSLKCREAKLTVFVNAVYSVIHKTVNLLFSDLKSIYKGPQMVTQTSRNLTKAKVIKL